MKLHIAPRICARRLLRLLRKEIASPTVWLLFTNWMPPRASCVSEPGFGGQQRPLRLYSNQSCTNQSLSVPHPSVLGSSFSPSPSSTSRALRRRPFLFLLGASPFCRRPLPRFPRSHPTPPFLRSSSLVRAQVTTTDVLAMRASTSGPPTPASSLPPPTPNPPSRCHQ